MSSTKSGIEWCDGTIETQLGCTKKSAGCDHCYAAALIHHRLSKAHPTIYSGLTTEGVDGVPRFNGVIRERPQGLVEILKAKRGARIFINSRSDTFHESASFEYIAAMFGCMAARPDVTFLVLTKRPERAVEFVAWLRDISHLTTLGWANEHLYENNAWGRALERNIKGTNELPTNVIVGTSIEDQKTADERIPHLLKLPGRRMLSCEPLLGEIDLRRHIAGIHWVIVGGESGKGARPMHPDWVRAIRDQCKEAGVPFFFKQWGDWREPTRGEPFNTGRGRAQRTPAFIVVSDGTCHCFHTDNTAIGAVAMLRVGKRAAGRLLDGVEHSEVPK